MRPLRTLVVLAGALSTFAAFGQCLPGPGQVALFEHRNYGGRCVTRDIGQFPDPNQLGLPNDSATAVRVGASVEVLLCTDRDYLGDCELVTTDRADFSGSRIGNDRLSSYVVRPRGTRTCVPGANEVSVYLHSQYEGTCVVKPLGDYPTPQAMGFPNDAMSAARVGANVQLSACVDVNYAKDCQTFTADAPDFFRERIGNDRISSMKVQPRGFQECVPTASQASFYSNSNFNPPCVVKGVGDYPDQFAIGLANDSIRSLRVGASVQVCGCYHANFMGQCRPFLFDARDVVPNFNLDLFSSLRVTPQRTNECKVPVSSGFQAVEVTNCLPSQRFVEVRVNYITRDGENVWAPGELLASNLSGSTCHQPAFPFRVPLPHAEYVRVIVVEVPDCGNACLRADTGVIAGYITGEVKSLLIR